MNYYNENDPFAIDWLRRLIDAGHLPPGDVDTRSIKDVSPDDLTAYTQCHFFAGIGGWPLAFSLAGWPTTRPVWSGSCPCQPWSAAGKGKGVDDNRHLWPDWYRLIDQCRPSIVFGEQVASKAGLAWFDIVSTQMEASDYAIGAADLPASGIGSPQIRQRLWFVALANANEVRREGSQRFERIGETVQQTTGYRLPDRLDDSQRTGLEGQRGDGHTSDKPGRLNTPAGGPITTSGSHVRMADHHSHRRNQTGQGVATTGNDGGLSETTAICSTPVRLAVNGQVLTGCWAAMESSGQLSPEHSRWLMGYPVAWGFCGVTATP